MASHTQVKKEQNINLFLDSIRLFSNVPTYDRSLTCFTNWKLI